jgi:hypothetical protein
VGLGGDGVGRCQDRWNSTHARLTSYHTLSPTLAPIRMRLSHMRAPAPTTPLLTMLLAGFFLALTLPLQVTSSSPYLCKCTCFSTNSTILPLLSPIDPSNPCTTCTRQFCLDQKLYGCEGARIENPNADTGTGWEGEVWARCFRE